MTDILKKHPLNSQGRDFVIGDLHGCYEDFIRLLGELDFDTRCDRMFSVGDLVDRGPKNMECLRLIKEPWFHSVRGNHEDLMICAVLDNNQPDLWHLNGGDWSYKDNIDPDEVTELCKLASKLPLAITVDMPFGRIGICHAEAPKDWSSIDNDMGRDAKYKMIWDRTKIQHKDTWTSENIDYTIHGHTPVTMPVAFGNSIYIDTGVVFKGRILDGGLTCLEMARMPEIAVDVSWTNVKKRLEKENRGLFD